MAGTLQLMVSPSHTAIFVISEDWYYWSHRRVLARELMEQGYQVILVTRVNSLREEIEADGVRLIDLSLSRASFNVLRDFKYVKTLYELYRRERPDLVYHVAFKPVLYGAIAARLARVPHRVNAIAGMGVLFSNHRISTRIVRWIVMRAFSVLFNRPECTLIVQNQSDFGRLQKRLRLLDQRICLIRGAGVDIRQFTPRSDEDAAADSSDGPVITHVSRLIRDKGIEELALASRELKRRGLRFRLQVVGEADMNHVRPISPAEIMAWQDEGLLEWKGHSDDIATIYQESDIAVLASYSEGLPKSLLEACACGLPIVTTDNPGCREVVEHGRNGLIVPVRDHLALADALQKLIENPEMRRQMGEQSRERAVNEFSLELIVEQTMKVFGVNVEKCPL